MNYELLQIELRRIRVGDVFDDEYLQDHSDAVILDKAEGVCLNPLQLYDEESNFSEALEYVQAENETDKYGNTPDEILYCTHPDCGCPEARLCSAKYGFGSEQ